MTILAKAVKYVQSLLEKLFGYSVPDEASHEPENQMYPRVLFVLKYREGYDPYCYNMGSENWGDGDRTPKRPLSSGLFNSAKMVVEMLEKEGVPVKLVHVIDNSFIHRELVEFKADIVVIEAFWVVPEKFDELRQVCPNVKFVIRNHSETPFLAQEGIAFDWMLKYFDKPNVIMTSNAARMHRETRLLYSLSHPGADEVSIRRKVAYLPNYYTIDSAPNEHYVCDDNEVINIGCFGAIRPLKNQLLQAIAALEFTDRIGKRLRFHVNGKRVEMNGDQVMKNLRLLFSHFPQHELVEHPWMSHSEFKKLVASMDIMMQVSFSETFNIVAADAVSQGVLTITSPEVAWSDEDVQSDPTSSRDIANVMDDAWATKLEDPCWNPSLHGLHEYNKKSVKEWLHFLDQFKKH